MRLRQFTLSAIALVAVGSLAACGGAPTGTPGETPGGGSTPAGTAGLGEAPPTTAVPTTAGVTTTAPAAAPALTCAKVRNATLGSSSVAWNGYDGIPLLDGVWAGEDGNSVEVGECATGDLNGDGAVDALAAVKLDGGGTGRFISLVFWRNSAGNAKFTASLDLGDRTPVESIMIAGGKAEVVWLTRGPDDPLAAVTVRRTSIMAVSGSTISELTHSDEPYTP